MADVSYTPVFHHTDWVDKVDRVQAGGPNGVNIRFNAIERDLHEASTVVTQVAAALRDMHASAPGQQQTRITLTPSLRSIPSTLGWSMSKDGRLTALSSAQFGAAFGVANIALPDRARLTTVRIVGDVDGPAPNSGAISLMRIPLRISAGQNATTLASAPLPAPAREAFDATSTVGADVASVDPSTFRYFITASYQNLSIGNAHIEAIHISFTPPA